MIKLTLKVIYILFTLALITSFVFIYVLPRLNDYDSKNNGVHNDVYVVKKVIDGDTFELDTKDKLKVRMLGIDCPEKHESNKLDDDAKRTGQDKKTIQMLGKLSSDYSQKLLEGKNVKLIPEKNYEDKDKYGRLLRYVYLEDGTFINKKLVEDGYAYAFRKYRISKLEELIEAEKTARLNNKGLWGEVEGLKLFDGNVNKK